MVEVYFAGYNDLCYPNADRIDKVFEISYLMTIIITIAPFADLQRHRGHLPAPNHYA